MANGAEGGRTPNDPLRLEELLRRRVMALAGKWFRNCQPRTSRMAYSVGLPCPASAVCSPLDLSSPRYTSRAVCSDSISESIPRSPQSRDIIVGACRNDVMTRVYRTGVLQKGSLFLRSGCNSLFPFHSLVRSIVSGRNPPVSRLPEPTPPVSLQPSLVSNPLSDQEISN
jgi:hypothetical protein